MEDNAVVCKEWGLVFMEYPPSPFLFALPSGNFFKSSYVMTGFLNTGDRLEVDTKQSDQKNEQMSYVFWWYAWTRNQREKDSHIQSKNYV